MRADIAAPVSPLGIILIRPAKSSELSHCCYLPLLLADSLLPAKVGQGRGELGFVAGEITKNRGIAICAPIAPYESTRAEIRASIEAYGGFVEVHVCTPLEVCEKRDRKGMYAKARAGLIKGFTGLDDPYEDPQSPEVRLDTTDLTPNEAAQEILLFLGQKGYI